MYKVQKLAHLNSFMLLWFTAFKRQIQEFLFLSGKEALAWHIAASRTCTDIWGKENINHYSGGIIEMSHFVVLNFMAHFCLLWCTSLFISVNSYIFLILLLTFSLGGGENVFLAPFRRRIFNRSFSVFLVSWTNLLWGIQSTCQNS